jgi:hypothetical protein
VSHDALPLHDVRAIAEVLADVLAERGVVPPEPNPAHRVMNAAEVAKILGRDVAGSTPMQRSSGHSATATDQRDAWALTSR